MEVQNGGKPILQEVGPYRYIEWKEKVNLVDDIGEDTITYSNLNTWYFLKEKSLPLTGDEMVTIPHLPLLSVLLVAEQDFPTPMLTIVNAAVPHIYGKLGSVFMTAKVRELLFDGVLIDCTAKNIVPKAICIAIKQNSKALVKLGKNKYLFSFFGIRNATPEDVRITVKKGVQDVYSIGKVVAMNGNTENVVWSGGECRRFSGTDSTIFPPFRKPDNYSIVAFSPEICRTMSGSYVGEGAYQGVRGYRYVVSLGDMKRNPGEMCFCPSPDRCLGKGTTDLTKCQGAPLIGSLPHFYDAEEEYLNGVVGMKPDKDKHEITFIMEPISGVPLLARKRLQFNIHLHPVRFVNLTKKLTPTLVPIFWLEENLDLGDELMGFLEANLLT
ncbi:sensory neuron membrane protein 1, partial [Halyomorpha halys]|uniref:sensory neuron membrane protein 1 n=1 Tax=Halyomorpha halys TaxID=286706 RepID=UPI0006D4F7B3